MLPNLCGLVLGILFASSAQCAHLDENLDPTIQLIILCHPFNKASILPFTLGSISHQNYDKQRLNVQIRTEAFDEAYFNYHNETNPEIDGNRKTINILQKWTDEERNYMHDIDLDIRPIVPHNDVDDEIEKKYWNYERFKRIVELKNQGFSTARRRWADYVLFMDADVVLVNPNTFAKLIAAAHDKPIISPMLYTLSTYSNFWAGMSELGYYQRTDEYIPILERQKIGSFNVPMVHSCVFVSLRHRNTERLTFDSSLLDNSLPYDDMISFAMSANRSQIPMYINNEEVWGYILPPITDPVNLKNIEQDVIDLELESLVEQSSFPIAPGLAQYVKYPEEDKLGVEKIYMINLARRIDRLQRMITCFKVIGIHANVWPAVDGKKITEEYLNKLEISVLPGYLDPYHKRPMTFGEIGCFLSHYFIWKDVIEKNLSKVIVFEDDVRFEKQFKTKMKDAVKFMKQNPELDFMYIGRKRYGKLENEPVLEEGFRRPTYSYWTIGYLITNEGARKLIDAQPLTNILPVDEFLPLMFDQQPHTEWVKFYPKRNLAAISVDPLLIAPTHYTGDKMYISDTEDTDNISDLSRQVMHPKHSEL